LKKGKRYAATTVFDDLNSTRYVDEKVKFRKQKSMNETLQNSITGKKIRGIAWKRHSGKIWYFLPETDFGTAEVGDFPKE
jgi:lauroyl/myristoyl acyltransferase